MKLSNYTFDLCLPEEGQVLIYNSLSNNLAVLETDEYAQLIECKKGTMNIYNPELLNELIRGGFLIEDNVDELKTIRLSLQKERFRTDHLSITIAPTLDCNFSCIYCYEQQSKDSIYMNEDVENAIVQFVKAKIKNISILNVTWYGGEPLLSVSSIQKLSEKIIEICDQNDVNYSASVVTNGYFLTKKTWEILRQGRVTHIQITVDGDRDIHDQRRCTENHEPTYDCILNNIQKLKKDIAPISMRINIDKSNMGSIESLLDDICQRGLMDVVNPYLGKVDAGEGYYDQKICLSDVEFFEFERLFQRLLIKKGFHIDRFTKYPKRVFAHCAADTYNSFVINADGTLYACWEDIGDQGKSIGNILDGDATSNISRYLDFMTFDPTIDSKCSLCKILPLCMGGCPVRRIRGAHTCSKYKWNLEEDLIDFAHNIMRNQSL